MGPLIPQVLQKQQFITNEVVEKIVSLKQSGINFAKIATWLQLTKAVIKQEFWDLLKRGGTKLAKKPKKQDNSQIKEVYPLKLSVTKVTALRPQEGIEPAPSHQAGLAGGGDLPAPGFLLFKANPGSGTVSALVIAEGPALRPKSYTQALVGLAGPGQANFIYPVNPVQAHPPLSNLGPPIGDPFFNQVFWPQESLLSQSKNDDQIGKTHIAQEAKPSRTNGQSSQDGPSKSQTTVHENPKNNHEAANQTAEPEMPSPATQLAPEECPEAPACE
ncbi:hypothetical protein DSO57_1023816 [Entomophthora muscae]|uniref:Uncharacterized protein n=1 Tax=Entomophthora muscae TaxID=34485 RepID=A0ACC2UCX7_9FUNG|nr:hypothetical protein DSO57_1023816 [Entomophthora muscae]